MFARSVYIRVKSNSVAAFTQLIEEFLCCERPPSSRRRWQRGCVAKTIQSRADVRQFQARRRYRMMRPK
jgi:hypothetical protein